MEATPERLTPPYGVVFLPSPVLDTMDDRWLEWIRLHPTQCATVNLAFFSVRFRDAGALPGHTVWIDHPKLYAKGAARYQDVPDAFANAERDGVRIWGSYEYWFLDERFMQRKVAGPNGEQFPDWCGPDRAAEDKESWRRFAGQYTSCAACNVLALCLGWRATILVVGNSEAGGYCELSFKPTEKFRKEKIQRHGDDRVASADDLQWNHLRTHARGTDTEIVHVDGPTRTVPRLTEAEALEVIYGA